VGVIALGDLVLRLQPLDAIQANLFDQLWAIPGDVPGLVFVALRTGFVDVPQVQFDCRVVAGRAKVRAVPLPLVVGPMWQEMQPSFLSRRRAIFWTMALHSCSHWVSFHSEDDSFSIFPLTGQTSCSLKASRIGHIAAFCSLLRFMSWMDTTRPSASSLTAWRALERACG
jgi:hypothetical protein